MSKSRILPWAIGVVLAASLPFGPALAQIETFVSAANGLDTRGCIVSTDPCRTFQGAIGKTSAGGQITVLDSGDFGPVIIDRPLSIVNNTGATATIVGTTTMIAGQGGQIIISDASVVTLRGLTLNGGGNGNINGIVINNALAVDIQNCVILNGGVGIVIAPALDGHNANLPPAFHVKVTDTAIMEGVAGIRIGSVPGVAVNVALNRTSIDNNNGAGVRADGSGGGLITASIADSSIAYNNGNGVLALSGAGNVAVHVTRTVIASNVSSGIQSNQASGGLAAVTVRGSTLTNNANGAVNSFSGGALLTFGDNNIVGLPGTGFTGPITLQ